MDEKFEQRTLDRYNLKDVVRPVACIGFSDKMGDRNVPLHGEGQSEEPSDRAIINESDRPILASGHAIRGSDEDQLHSIANSQPERGIPESSKARTNVFWCFLEEKRVSYIQGSTSITFKHTQSKK